MATRQAQGLLTAGETARVDVASAIGNVERQAFHEGQTTPRGEALRDIYNDLRRIYRALDVMYPLEES